MAASILRVHPLKPVRELSRKCTETRRAGGRRSDRPTNFTRRINFFTPPGHVVLRQRCRAPEYFTAESS